MKPVPLASRCANRLAVARPTATRPAISPIPRCGYATTQHHRPASSTAPAASKRKAVTPFNDDGRVPWTELTAGEKTGRAAQQTFNLGLVFIGVVLTGGVVYLLYSDVFSSDSKVRSFNRAVDRIKKDSRCLELLGDRAQITAYGQETWNKWRRARPIASSSKRDAQGSDHLLMNFNVEGPLNKGVVNLHLVRRAGQGEYQYRYLYLDVPGHQRIYLENADAAVSQKAGQTPKTKLFGINWA